VLFVPFARKAIALPAVNLRVLRRGLAGAALALPLAVAGLAHAQEAETPTETVEEVNEALLHVMRNARELGFEGRQALLEPVLTDAFNLPEMARVAVGRHWDKFSEAEKAELVDRFTDLSISTFAARFDGYSGQEWQIAGTLDAPRGGVIVRNRLEGPDRSVNIDYLLQETDEGEWRIVDVYLDGSISELALRRSEFTSVLKAGGVDNLLDQIAQQVDKLGSKSVTTN
jgi:phospholipid transport system substrate-binding protein